MSSISGMFLSLGFLLSLALLCCAGGRSDTGTAKVEYKVEGSNTGRASLTYSNAEGGTEQLDAALPWSTKFTCKPGEFLYLSAQNKEDGGAILIQILINGKVEKLSSSSGGYVIATADARCPFW